LTASARLVVKEPLETNCWIVNDGDIDPEWVESLNSVLDDNHLLTLPNGERINFGNNINFIFETHEMKYGIFNLDWLNRFIFQRNVVGTTDANNWIF
jgi:dynein heavy chain 2